MTQTILPPIKEADPPKDAQLKALARRYRSARGPVMKLVSALGGPAEASLSRLPAPVRARLEGGTLKALEYSFAAAQKSRGSLPDAGDAISQAITVATGAAGGFGGVTTALAELPITTTVILRAIQSISNHYGFDPRDDDTRADCLQVFAAAGPMAEDDSTDLTFLTLRVTMTGASVQAMLKAVAPRLAIVLGQKLAAQTVPILGAVTGAAINYSYTAYYQEMAHIQFALRKLAEETGHNRAALIAEFQDILRRT